MIEHSEHEPMQLQENVVLEDWAHEGSDGVCVHCQVVVGVPPDMALHADFCPYTTGLWFVAEAVRTYVCSNCEEQHTGHLACFRCRRFFEVGDPYRLVDEETQLVVPWVAAPALAVAICARCADKQAEALMERFS